MPLNHAMESREYFKTYRLFISIWSASLALAVDHRTRALWVSSPQSRHMASLPPLAQMIQEPLPPSSSPPCNTHPQLHCQWGFWQHGNVSCFWAFLAHAVSVMFSFTCHRHQPCSRLCSWCETLYNGDTLYEALYGFNMSIRILFRPGIKLLRKLKVFYSCNVHFFLLFFVAYNNIFPASSN